MQGIIAVIVFGLIILAIIVLVVINFTYKGLRQIRQAAEEAYARNQKEKEQKDKNPFGDDYFRSSDGNSQRFAQRQYEQKAQRHGGPQQRKQKAPKDDTARRTTTGSGVTIIDGRSTSDKKIFNHDDGEYVEFEEVHG